MHDYLTERGLRDRSEISLVMPLRRADPAVAGRVGGAPRRLRRAGHPLAPRPAGARARPGRARWSLLADGGELPYDLFLGVPVHQAPEVVEQSGLCVDGWIPVDPLTLRDRLPRRLRGR